jgi:HK97 family phage portal protein
MNPLVKAWRTADQFVARGFKSMFFGRSAGGYGWSYWLTGRSRYDYAGAVGDGTGNSAVAACLGWIGRTFPEAPVEVRRRKGTEWESIPDHPMVALLEQPNPYYSGAVLWAATLASYHADGNAYWIKDRTGANGVAGLWFAPHTVIEPVSDSDTEFIQYYRYQVAGREFRLSPADVVHFRNGLDPNNPRLGCAPLKTALREVFADDEAANFFGALMRNMGIPGVILSAGSDEYPLSADEAEATKAKYEQNFGADNRGRTMVTTGSLKVEKLAFNPEEMDLKNLRRLPEERISAVLGIPAIVAGLGAGLDRSTFANYAEAREAAWEDNIIPTQRILAADLTTQLLRDFDDNPALRVAFDNSAIRVLQPDQTAITARTVQTVQAGIMTVAEARRELGMDAGPEHEFYMIPSGYEVRAELEAPEPEPVDALPPGDVPPQLEAPTDDDFTALLSGGRRDVDADRV